MWAAAALALATATAGPSSDYVSAVETEALISQLNAQLLASSSATSTLEQWCAAHHMAEPARLSAVRDKGPPRPATPETRARLQVGADEPLGFRHVRLACGRYVMSEADNWYVASRLSVEMNRVLDTTDTPFGRAVLALGVHRQTVSAERIWSPLPADWIDAPVGAIASPQPVRSDQSLFRHRAILLTPAGLPVSEVVETYQGAVLDFPRHAASPGSVR